MEKMPNDLLIYLFNFFHPIEQNEFRLVCRKWCNIIKSKSLQYRLQKQIKPLEIILNRKNPRGYTFSYDGSFIYIVNSVAITKYNKFTGKRLKNIFMFYIYYFFVYNEGKLLVITGDRIRILDNKKLQIIEDNFFEKKLVYNITFYNGFLYALSNQKADSVLTFDVYGKKINELKTGDYIINSFNIGYRNNLYTFSDNNTFNVWKAKTNKKMTTITLPYNIYYTAFNKKTYDYCVQTRFNYIYIFNKRNTIIRKIEDNSMIFSFLLSFTLNNNFVFMKYDTIYVLGADKIICSFIGKEKVFGNNNLFFKTINENAKTTKILMY